MMSGHRLLLGMGVLFLGGTMFPEEAARAADHAPAVAERAAAQESPEVIRRYGNPAFRTSARYLAFSPDGRWLAAENARGVVLFDAKTGEVHRTFPVGYGNSSGFTFSPDGKSIAVADPRGLSVWDIQKGAVSTRLEGENKNRLTHARFTVASPDRQWRLNHNYTREIAVVKWDQMEPVKKISFNDRFPSLAVGAEGKWIAAAGGQSNEVLIWKAPKFDSPVKWKLRSIIRCLDSSPDGETLYAGVGDRTLHAWNIKEGRETSQFQIDSRSWPVSMTVSPDGKLAAIASTRNVTIYEIDSGRLIHTVEWFEQVSGVGLAFAPDGKTLAVCPWGRSLEIWDVKAKRPIHQPGPAIENVFATRDFQRFGSYSELTVRLWNPKTGELEESFPLYPWPKETIAPPGEILFDGVEQLIIKQPEGEVLYRDLTSGRKTFERLGKLQTEAMLLGYNRQMVKVFDLGPGALCLRIYSSGIPGDTPRNVSVILDVPTSPCLDIALSEDGPILAAAFADKSLFIWETTRGKQRHRLKLEQTPRRVFLNSTGDWLAVSHQDSISVWDPKTGKPVHQFETPDAKSHTIAFASKQKLLAAAIPGKPIRLWNLETGKEALTLPAPDFPAESMDFSPDGKRLAVGYRDKTVGVFDLGTREESHVFQGHTAPVTHVKFNPEGSRLASASQKPELFVWDTTTGKKLSLKSQLQSGIQRLYWIDDGKEILVIEENQGYGRFHTDRDQVRVHGSFDSLPLRPMSFAYCPDRRLLAVGYDRGIRTLDLATGRELPFLRVKMGANHMEWSSDGKVLMIAADELFGWDVENQKEAYRIPAPGSQYESPVRSMARSPDGRIVATAHAGRFVCLWDPQTGKLLRKIENQNLWSLQNLRFSADGRLLFGLSSSWFHVIEAESGLIWFQKSDESPRDLSFAPLGRWKVLSGELAGGARLWTWAPVANAQKGRSLEELWDALFASEGKMVYLSMFAMRDQGDETVEFLARHLPMDSVPAEKVTALIKDLEDDSLKVRRNASEELRKLGSQTRPHLEAALEKKDLSPRVEIRIQQLLSSLDSAVSPEQIATRAVQLLEWIGTSKARKLIQEWAKKPAGRLALEAQAALRRLSSSKE